MKAVERAVDTGLAALCTDIVETAKAKMKEPKTGKDYRPRWRQAGKKRRPRGDKQNAAMYFKRVSSAPGEAPAVQAGDLIGHVNQKKLGPQTFAVGTDMKHGAWLEVGTKNIKKRPWLRPSVYEHTGRDAEIHFADKVQ